MSVKNDHYFPSCSELCLRSLKMCALTLDQSFMAWNFREIDILSHLLTAGRLECELLGDRHEHIPDSGKKNF